MVSKVSDTRNTNINSKNGAEKDGKEFAKILQLTHHIRGRGVRGSTDTSILVVPVVVEVSSDVHSYRKRLASVTRREGKASSAEELVVRLSTVQIRVRLAPIDPIGSKATNGVLGNFSESPVQETGGEKVKTQTQRVTGNLLPRDVAVLLGHIDDDPSGDDSENTQSKRNCILFVGEGDSAIGDKEFALRHFGAVVNPHTDEVKYEREEDG